MENILNSLAGHTMAAVITSLFLVSGLVIIRMVLMKAVRRKSHILSKEQRRWMNQIKNGFFTLLVVGLILIWAPQLQTFALSLTAVAVAVVVATKEMILCLMGGFMRTATQPFKVGDWISMDGVAGEVIDVNAFAFVIQEIDIAGKTYQFTGQTIEIPNSRFFTSTIENLTFMKAYIFLDMPVTVAGGDIDPALLNAKLMEIAARHFEPLKDAAAPFLRRVERKAGVSLPAPAPAITMRTTDLGHIIFNVRMMVPTAQAAAINRATLEEFLAFVYAQREKIREEEEARKDAREAKKAAG